MENVRDNTSMRKRQKQIFLIVGALAGLLLAACGVKGTGGVSDVPSKESAENGQETLWQTQYQDIDGLSGSILHAELLEDTVYLILNPDPDAGSKGQRLYRLTEDKASEAAVKDLGEGDSVAGLSVTPEGSLRIAILHYEGEEPTGCELRTVSPEGFTEDRTDITAALFKDLPLGIERMSVDGEGNTLLMNGKGVYVFDRSGKLSFSVPGLFTSDLTCTDAGDPVAGLFVREGGMEIRGIDLQSRTLSEAHPVLKVTGGRLKFVRRSRSELLYYSRDSLYAYHEDTGETAVLSFMEQGINGQAVAEILQKENGDLLLLAQKDRADSDPSYSGPSSSTLWQAVTVAKADADAELVKTEIVLGTMVTDDRTRSQVVAFNKSDAPYKVEIRQYMGPSVDSDQALVNLNTDVMTGHAPDLIDLTGIPGLDMYIAKGLLEDLTPWMEQDAEIKEKQYLNNILNVCAREGRLYGVIPDFRIGSSAAKQALVGDRVSWTLDELLEIAENTEGLARIYPKEFEKTTILQSLVLYSLDRYIDWETGECAFDSEAFVRLLTFADANGADEPDRGLHMEEALEARIKELHVGTLLLNNVWLQDVYDYVTCEAYFGEPVSLIGNPVESGCGSEIWPGRAYGIVSTVDEKKKEGAWQFLRTFLLEEYQDHCTDSFPVLESSLLKKYEEATTPDYYTDADGVKAEKEKTVKSLYGKELPVYAMTQEQINRLDTLIHSLHRIRGDDYAVRNILVEEASAFFQGGKTAGEAAKIIQNRVQIYVSENR